MIRIQTTIDNRQESPIGSGEKRKSDRCWNCHNEEETRHDRQSHGDSALLLANMSIGIVTANMKQMIADTTIQADHQNERSTIVDREIEIIPLWIDPVGHWLNRNASIRSIRTTEQKEMKIEQKEECENASDDH